MSCVYGLRIKGDIEVRYVGMTAGKPGMRLSSHYANRNLEEPFRVWLAENRGNIDAFVIADCANWFDARLTEKVIISLCLRLNHRLFNRDHVPAHLRIAA